MSKKIYVMEKYGEYEVYDNLGAFDQGDEVYEITLPKKTKFVKKDIKYSLTTKKPEEDTDDLLF